MAENPVTSENIDSNVLIDNVAEKLDSDTRLDPEPLSFSDLPNEILGGIVEKLDLVSRLKTRKVSRRLRSVVDKQKAYYNTIGISAAKDHVHITFDEVMVHYSKSGCLLADEDYSQSVKHKFVENNNFLEIALNDSTTVLKTPKFQLKCFGLLFEIHAETETAKILALIKSLKYPIHVKGIFIESDINLDVLPILSLLKPETLEGINLVGMNEGTNADELVKMDQWKQAKTVYLGQIPVRLEDFLHFDEINLRVDSISPEDVLRLRNVFSKSTSFENCFLRFRGDSVNLDEIGRALKAIVNQTPWGPTIVHRHPIPGSKKFLEFNVDKDNLSIERKL